jgi:tight adherence protein B
MNRLLTTLCAVTFLLLSAAPALASGPGSLRIEDTDASDHPTVTVDVVAPRQLVDAPLDGEDFSVTEGGQVREVEAARLAPAAQEVVLAIDVSGSMQGPAIAAAKEAASEFVARVPEGVRMAVIAFASRPHTVVDFTNDKDDLVSGIAGLEATSYTALYDAVAKAAEIFAPGRENTQTLVVLSDGADTISGRTLSNARDLIAGVGATFYAIELETAATDRAALERLVSGAGGMVVTAGDPDALAAVYDAVAVDIGNRYTLRYRSGAFSRTDLGVTVAAGGVEQRVGGYLLELPEPPAWRRLLVSPIGLMAGLAASFGAFALAVFRVIAPRTPRVSLSRRGLPAGPTTTPVSGLAARTSSLIDDVLERRGWAKSIAAALERAGVRLRPGDFVVLVLGGGLACGAVGILLNGPGLALVAGLLVPIGAKLALGVLASRRQASFADQLDDCLQLLSGSLRAGHSLLQAVDAVSRETDAPASEEFARIVNETRLGRDLGRALDESAQRMTSDDFLWVSQAIAIHREVGGDLAEVLDTVGHTIRERNQIRRQVKALSAEGKLSAVILMGLPIGLLLFLMVVSPGYVARFTESATGLALLAAAAVMLSLGGLWLRKLVRFQF